ncbi:histone H1-like [Bidens hawaiensis]|uniref:histone H1-like n=1 Tax=Bidens hawaiensis TaxID=980011 RepID=UPI00404A8EB5
MATQDPIVPTANSTPAKSDVAVEKPKKVKKAPAKAKPRTPSLHPPYFEMIKEALVTLKERTGSSQYAIAKFIEENQKHLPANFKKVLLTQLKKLVAAGKLVKVKASYKFPAAKAPAAAAAPAKKKPVAKPKKLTPAKKKTVAKPKAVAKPAKAVKAPVKAAKVAKKTTPSKKAPKKAVVKSLKPKGAIAKKASGAKKVKK